MEQVLSVGVRSEVNACSGYTGPLSEGAVRRPSRCSGRTAPARDAGDVGSTEDDGDFNREALSRDLDPD
ncbi:unnamed protein product [Gadus morhua 'NCC']